MKLWEFTNQMETKVAAELPEDWKFLSGALLCPPGWLLILDAENDIIAFAPRDKALMLAKLFNELEETNRWEENEDDADHPAAHHD